MATDTKPKSRSAQIYEDLEYKHEKEEEVVAHIINDRSKVDPKKKRFYIDEIRKLVRKKFAFLPRNKIDKMTEELIRETEQHLHELATEHEEKKEKKEAEGYGHPMLKKEEEKTPVQKMQEALERNKQAQIAKGNTALAGPISPEVLKNNPYLAFKAMREGSTQQTQQTPTKKPGRLKRAGLRIKNIFRGGNANKGRGSRPVPHVPATPVKPVATKPDLKAVNTFMAAMERNKAAQQAKKDTTAAKPIVDQSTKVVLPPREEGTKPRPLGPLKPFIPIIPDRYSEEIIPDEEALGEIPPFIPEIDRGAAVAGNPNADPEESVRPPRTESSNQSAQKDDDDNNNNQPRPRGLRNLMRSTGGGGGGGKASKAAADAARMAARTAAQTARATGQLLVRAAVAIGPVGWAIIAAIAAVVIIILLIVGWEAKEEEAAAQRQGQVAETLTIVKRKVNPPDLVGTVGQIVNFEITVTDTRPASEIVIIDHVPLGVSMVDADITSSWTTNRIFNPGQRTLAWKASENLPPEALAGPNINFTISVSYKVTADKTYLVTYAEANPTRPTAAFNGQIPPSNDDCHGLYRSYMNMLARIGKSNYGDPNCQLAKQDPNGRWFIDKDMIFAFMTDSAEGPRLPRTEAEGVFVCIMPQECGATYNVNAYNPNSTSKQSRGSPGAFGCFQMNATGYSNGGQPEDVGDVVWQQQIINANAWRLAHNGGRWRNYWPQSYSGCLNEYGL